MLVLELRDLLLLFLVLLLTSICATALFVSWLAQRRHPLKVIESLKSVLDHAPAGVLVLDHKVQDYYFANVYAQRLLGFPQAGPQFARNSLPTNIKWLNDLQDDIERSLNSSQVVGVYRTLRIEEPKNESHRMIRWWVTGWNDLHLLFFVDITSHLESEQNTRIFLSSLSHELRTPLATILTHTEILALTIDANNTLGQSVNAIKGETERSIRLTNKALELGRIEASSNLEISPFNLLPLIEVVCNQMKLRANEASIDIAIEADTPLSLALGNADLLKQVFINLLENCIQHCHRDDNVTIKVQNHSSGILCEITDTGPGIDPKHLPHLTKRFYRAAPAGLSGNGLGLSFVHEILLQHQCQIVIESKSSTEFPENLSGTTVRFILPTLSSSVSSNSTR